MVAPEHVPIRDDLVAYRLRIPTKRPKDRLLLQRRCKRYLARWLLHGSQAKCIPVELELLNLAFETNYPNVVPAAYVEERRSRSCARTTSLQSRRQAPQLIERRGWHVPVNAILSGNRQP